MNNCTECSVNLQIDERINHQGKIVCGNCFLKSPKNLRTNMQDEAAPRDETILQMMQMIVDHDEKIQALTEEIEKFHNQLELFDAQIDSICG